MPSGRSLLEALRTFFQGPSRRVEWLCDWARERGLEPTGPERLGAFGGSVHGLPVVVKPELHLDPPAVFVRFDLWAGQALMQVSGRLGPEPDEFNGQFAELLKISARRRAIFELGEDVGPIESEDLPELKEQLFAMFAPNGGLAHTRLIIRASGQMRLVETAGHLFREYLKHEVLRTEIISAVEKIEPRLLPLLQLNASSSAQEIEAMRQTIANAEARQPHLDALIELLVHPETEVRVHVAEWLGEFGEAREREALEPHAVTALVTDHPLRRAAAAAIRRIDDRTTNLGGRLSLAEDRGGGLAFDQGERGALSPTED